MKKVLLLLFSFCGIFCMSAQTIINGIWNRDPEWGKKNTKISLFEVENGILKELAASNLSPQNEFLFAINQTNPAFYVIGTSLLSSVNNFVFYLNPNDRLNVIINNDRYKLVGDNTPQNKEMERWYNLQFPLEDKAVYFTKYLSSYVDYFPLLEEKLEDIDAFKPEYLDDVVFNAAFEKYMEYNILNDVLTFLNTPRTAHPQDEDYPDYINRISLSKITDSPALLNYPYGMSILERTRYLKNRRLKAKTPEEEAKKIDGFYESLRRDIPEIQNPLVRGELVLKATKGLKSVEGLLQYNEEFTKFLANDDQKQRMHQIMVEKSDMGDGIIAFDFKFPDVNGKEVKLSDFKGKVVYIDVWATWCGPCIKEIPDLKKLEAEYHNKDVDFLSVSVDKQDDYKKWEAFLIKEKLGGVQLFAGDKKEEIVKPYDISGIPRFILIGKDGKIIYTNAPRPGSSEIKLLLDAALKK